jgi:hypothetical protein
MNTRDSGIQWFSVPVFIEDGAGKHFQIVTKSREKLDEPVFLVTASYFNDVEKNPVEHKAMLEHLLIQFQRGKLEPLNAAAREAEKR